MLKVAWHPCYAHPLPDGHRFPMEKYNLLPEQLLYEGTLSSVNFFEPEMLDEASALSVHSEDYWQKLSNGSLTRAEERRTGFPFSDALFKRERHIMQGTLTCTHFALQHGIAMNIAGGTHHAYRAHGEGFCLLNDLAIAAMHLLKHKRAHRILMIDLDVHQGNGTAAIFANDERVFTFSMHGAKNYPMHKEPSDLDIGLPDGVNDRFYLNELGNVLPAIIDRHQPDFAFFQTGVDVLEHDKLGRLSLTLNGCRERDLMVLELCKNNNIPLVCAMGGGYSPDIRHIIEAHANTFRLAQELFF